MNWKNAFFISLAPLIAASGWVIKLNGEQAPQSVIQRNASQKTGATHENGTRPNPESMAMEIAPGTGEGAGEGIRCTAEEQQLDAVEARCRFESYLLYAQTLQRPDGFRTDTSGGSECDQYDLAGDSRNTFVFRIERPCELATMLRDATDRYHVFALLGMQQDPRPDHQGEAMFELLFAAKSRAIAGPTDAYNMYYYDFTTPCPPMCGTEWINTTVNHN
ncbi:MAG: hypothetical protein KDC61_01205 [Saprospiraceae bacterium]|nr:hypothetical protein [Saprospiraceae bacterium]